MSMPLRVVNGTIAIGNGDDLDAAADQFLTRHRADVAKALHDRRRFGGFQLQFLAGPRMMQ